MKQPTKILSILGGSILLGSFLYACTTPFIDESEKSQTPTIDLEQAVHFTASAGEDNTIQPGSYQVRARKDSLELVPGDDSRSIVIAAASTTHEEAVDTPTALSFSETENENAHFIVLMLPEGKGLEAAGSYSGIHSRATARATSLESANPAAL